LFFKRTNGACSRFPYQHIQLTIDNFGTGYSSLTVKNTEIAEQLAFLQQQDCDSYQDFFYRLAITAEAFVEL
jgi:EAL domain-containing protein (putative c-di-GMP-specific phosphodiesterase class I)